MTGLFGLLLVGSFLAKGALCDGDDPPYPVLPRAYSASTMINLKMGTKNGSLSMILSMFVSVDEDNQRSMLSSEIDDKDSLRKETLTMNKNAGVERFFYTIRNESDAENGECYVDEIVFSKDGLFFLLAMLDIDINDWYLPLSHLLWSDDFIYLSTVNLEDDDTGIIVHNYNKTFNTTGAILDINYYWTDPTQWTGTAGPNVSTPAFIDIEGLFGDSSIKIRVAFSDYQQVALPEIEFIPPYEMWCQNRVMKDELPTIRDYIMYDSEIVFSFMDIDELWVNIILPRTEWFDADLLISRADFKPPSLDNADPDPFVNSNGFISQIHDFNTGILYSINQDYGNCSVELVNEADNGADHGHIHMMSPFYMFYDQSLFAANGEERDRGIELDSYIRSGPIFKDELGINITSVVMLTSSDWEVDTQSQQQRFIPARIISYPTKGYGKKGELMTANYFNFRTGTHDLHDFDITPCFTGDNQKHFMIRFGWDPDMQIDQFVREFDTAARVSISLWAEVTPIRVQKIQEYHDDDKKFLYVVFTIVGYPLSDYNEHDTPGSIRTLIQAKASLIKSIDAGEFIIHFNQFSLVAEKSSLKELDSRGTDYEYKDGYTPGAMAACGLILLLVSIAGTGSLLVFVLKP